MWMVSSKGCYKRINKIHESSLRLILNDYEQESGSRWMSIERKSVWTTVRVINECHVHCFP